MNTDPHHGLNPVIQVEQPIVEPQPTAAGHKLGALVNKVHNAIKNFFVGSKGLKSRVIQVKKQMASDVQSRTFQENLKIFADQIKSTFRVKIPRFFRGKKASQKFLNDIKNDPSLNGDKVENKEAEQGLKQIRQDYNQLKVAMSSLSEKSKVRVTQEGQFKHELRENSHLPKTSSEDSQETFKKALDIINKGLDNNLFIIDDKEDLEKLIKQLKKEFRADIAADSALKDQFKQISARIDEHGAQNLYRQPETNLYTTNPRFKNALINPSELYVLFFNAPPRIKEELKTDFLLAAPWMRFFKTESQSNFKDLISQMSTAFNAENATDEDKLEILDFAQKLVERGFIKSADDLTDITQKGLDDEQSEAVRSKSADLATAQMKAKPESPFGLAYEVKQPNVKLQDKFADIAEGKKDPEFISKLTHDFITLASNGNRVPSSELEPENKLNSPTKNNNAYLANRFAACIKILILLQANTAQGRANLYKTFVKIGEKLITQHRDYYAASFIFGALTNAAVYNTILSDKIIPKADLERFSEFANDNSHTGRIQKKYAAHDNKEENYNPYLGAIYNFFESIDSSEDDDAQAVGFGKLSKIAKTIKQIEKIHNKPQETELNYDLNTFINSTTQEWWKKEGEQVIPNIDDQKLDRILHEKKESIHPRK